MKKIGILVMVLVMTFGLISCSSSQKYVICEFKFSDEPNMWEASCSRDGGVIKINLLNDHEFNGNDLRNLMKVLVIHRSNGGIFYLNPDDTDSKIIEQIIKAKEKFNFDVTMGPLLYVEFLPEEDREAYKDQ